MKRTIVIVLLVLVVEHAPFRVFALVAESMLMAPGGVRMQANQDRYWEAKDLQARLEQRYGYTITYSNGLIDSGNRLGVLDPRGRQMSVDRDLSWSQRYAVLAHEGAHALEPPRLTTNQGEVFAECVALLVAKDGLREHARYLSAMRADVLMTALSYWPEMYRVAGMLRE